MPSSVFRNRLFRDRALIRNAQPEPLDGLLRVTAPHEWLLLAALAATVLASVAWSAFASVERTVSGDGALVRPGERHTVVSALAATVKEVTAQVGERVEAGQAIARLELPELGWRLRVARARVALLEERAAEMATRTQTWLDAELAAARREMLELAAVASAGAVIVSPRAGEIAAHSLVAGRTVEAEEPVAEIRAGAGGAPEAVLFVPSVESRDVSVGMEARVAVAGRSGSRVFRAEVAEISPRPADPPSWLSRFGLLPSAAPDAPGHLVRLTVSGAASAQIPDGTPCRIEIILARHSPLGLLVSWVL